jgi:cytochrome b6-f complex iron-sulfur subunit
VETIPGKGPGEREGTRQQDGASAALDTRAELAKPGAAQLSRRSVLESALVAVGGAGLLGAVAPILRYLSPPPDATRSGPIEIPFERLALWEPERIVVAGRPGYVLRMPNGIRAFSGVCTHLGCVVRWQRGRREFFCPCHGGRFGPDGRVLGGPLPRPLANLDIRLKDGKVIVPPA